ncbi:hypothetical protein EF909_18335 [Streptomyces sp. WAC01280]|nr:hypothetical protein EF909_18335 [Streptomyces sp. WAC01280]
MGRGTGGRWDDVPVGRGGDQAREAAFRRRRTTKPRPAAASEAAPAPVANRAVESPSVPSSAPAATPPRGTTEV